MISYQEFEMDINFYFYLIKFSTQNFKISIFPLKNLSVALHLSVKVCHLRCGPPYYTIIGYYFTQVNKVIPNNSSTCFTNNRTSLTVAIILVFVIFLPGHFSFTIILILELHLIIYGLNAVGQRLYIFPVFQHLTHIQYAQGPILMFNYIQRCSICSMDLAQMFNALISRV